MQIFESSGSGIKFEKGTKFDLIDRAAAGDVAAAGLLSEGYLFGRYQCEKNHTKAYKWAKYAARKGDEVGKRVLAALES